MECFAADFRSMAREALRGRWRLAILTSFVASLIGAWIGGSSSSGVEIDSETASQIPWGSIPSVWFAVILSSLGVIGVYAVVLFIIGGAGKLGYAGFNLKLVDGEKVSLRDLFSQFHRLGEGFVMNFLTGLYIFLWSLLFIIPGVVKSFSYAMTPYILSEHREYSAKDAIDESRRIMDGNRWRLFCLRLSFIGWDLLCAVPSIVGSVLLTVGAIRLWQVIPFALCSFLANCVLHPYEEAAQAAFYRDITTAVYSSEDVWSTGGTDQA